MLLNEGTPLIKRPLPYSNMFSSFSNSLFIALKLSKMFEDKMATYYVVMVEQASGIEKSSVKPKVENTLDRLPNVIIVVNQC